MIVFQSSAVALRPCPSGTFANSQQHARVIYSWVHRPLKTQTPRGMTEILCLLVGFGPFYSVHSVKISVPSAPLLATFYAVAKIRVHQCLSMVKKTAFLPNEPIFPLAQFFQSNSKPFKAIQRFWRKNYLFFPS